MTPVQARASHRPATQSKPGSQATLHFPQLERSELGSRQRSPQQMPGRPLDKAHALAGPPSEAQTVIRQAPPMQTESPGQAVRLSPQAESSSR